MKYLFGLALLLLSSAAFCQRSLWALTDGDVITKTVGDSLAAIMNKKAVKLFSQVSTVTVSGYTVNTAYSLKGTIVGNDTIKANPALGTTIVGFESGNFTSPTLNVGTITVNITLGSTTILTGTFSGLPVGVSALSPYSSKITLTVRSGAVAADGYIDFTPVSGTSAVRMPFTTTTTNIDWTTDKVYNVTISYSNAGNLLTSVNHTLFQY